MLNIVRTFEHRGYTVTIIRFHDDGYTFKYEDEDELYESFTLWRKPKRAARAAKKYIMRSLRKTYELSMRVSVIQIEEEREKKRLNNSRHGDLAARVFDPDL